MLVSGDPSWPLGLASAWVAAGDAVTVVLLDAAAAAARPGHAAAAAVAAAMSAGVAVVAHDDALRRRGLEPGAVVDGVKVVDLEEVTDLVAEGSDKAVWL